MKKRFLALVGLLVVAGTAQLFAWGIGVQGGASVGGAGGAAVTFKLDESPLVFAVDASFYSNYIGRNVCYFLDPPLNSAGQTMKLTKRNSQE